MKLLIVVYFLLSLTLAISRMMSPFCFPYCLMQETGYVMGYVITTRKEALLAFLG